MVAHDVFDHGPTLDALSTANSLYGDDSDVLGVKDLGVFVLGRFLRDIKHAFGPLSVGVKAEVLIGRDDADGVGVAHTTSPALHTDDGIALGQYAELHGVANAPLETLVNILLPWGVLEVGLLDVVVEWPDTTVQVRVAGGATVTGDHDDGAHGAVLGDEAGGAARGGEDEDGTGVLLEGSRDGGHGASLGSGDGRRHESPELVEGVDVRDGDLGEKAGLVHHGDGLLGVVALGGLARQHDAVGTVEDGVSNIGNFGTGGTRVVGHGLEHLGGTNGGLAGNVALGDHHLLGDEDLGWGNLDTEITTGNHDTVSLLQDVVEVVDTLLVLNLGDDLDVLAVLAEALADGQDVLAGADEGSEDHVDAVLDTEPQIGLVLLGESRKVDISAGKVDTLLGGDLAVVDGAALEGLLVDNLEDLEGEDTVVDVDDTALLDDLCDVLVVDVPE